MDEVESREQDVLNCNVLASVVGTRENNRRLLVKVHIQLVANLCLHHLLDRVILFQSLDIFHIFICQI